MYEVKEHPVFDQVMRRIETRDYDISYDTEWFFAKVTFRFKSGFCKGINFELPYNNIADVVETAREIKTFVSSGLFGGSEYIEPEKLPYDLKDRLVEIADKLVADKKKAAAIAYENRIVTTLDKAFE
jgi:hypothetical protein